MTQNKLICFLWGLTFPYLINFHYNDETGVLNYRSLVYTPTYREPGDGLLSVT